MDKRGSVPDRYVEGEERAESTDVRFLDSSDLRVLRTSDSNRSVVLDMSPDWVQEGSSVAETVLEEGEED